MLSLNAYGTIVPRILTEVKITETCAGLWVRLVVPAIVFCVSASLSTIVVAQSPPEPPEGYRWVKNEAFSDEFNGTDLDSSKWHDHNPRWKGRVPGKFVPSSVSVKDGFLQIKSTVLDPPDGEFTIACGAIQSKSQDALYGYYECRMKASSISTSSTFWLTNTPVAIPGGTLGLELDIQECIGNAQRWPSFKSEMKSNTHINFRPDNKDEEKKEAKKGGSTKLRSNVGDEFHTYGCWWANANEMKFYADGMYAFTITPSTDIVPHPFEHPLFMNLVCETYAWETPPTADDLADDSRNTTYYDYVRSYKLVKAEPTN
ncbi:family 16 glycosylhydrolase [Rubripirellula amarantea]|nr:family 16 glycosylhydrolase [Rubripirellula amarantea]